MYWLYVVAVWLHILSAAIWIGGMIFFAVVVVPVLRQPKYREEAGELIHRTGVRFRALGWGAIAMLIASGTYLLANRGVSLGDIVDPAFYATSFGRTVGLKLLVVATIVGLSLVHDFAMGPRATRILREAPSSPSAMRLRMAARHLGRLNLLLALLVLVFAVMLVRGAPW